jgi:hypothetical protein
MIAFTGLSTAYSFAYRANGPLCLLVAGCRYTFWTLASGVLHYRKLEYTLTRLAGGDSWLS